MLVRSYVIGVGFTTLALAINEAMLVRSYVIGVCITTTCALTLVIIVAKRLNYRKTKGIITSNTLATCFNTICGAGRKSLCMAYNIMSKSRYLVTNVGITASAGIGGISTLGTSRSCNNTLIAVSMLRLFGSLGGIGYCGSINHIEEVNRISFSNTVCSCAKLNLKNLS